MPAEVAPSIKVNEPKVSPPPNFFSNSASCSPSLIVLPTSWALGVFL